MTNYEDEPNEIVFEVRVEGDLFNPHKKEKDCDKRGCIPEERVELVSNIPYKQYRLKIERD